MNMKFQEVLYNRDNTVNKKEKKNPPKINKKFEVMSQHRRIIVLSIKNNTIMIKSCWLLTINQNSIKN